MADDSGRIEAERRCVAALLRLEPSCWYGRGRLLARLTHELGVDRDTAVEVVDELPCRWRLGESGREATLLLVPGLLLRRWPGVEPGGRVLACRPFARQVAARGQVAAGG